MIRLRVLMPILLVAFIVVGCASAPSPEPSQEAKKEVVARESPTRETAPPATPMDKVVIGVLGFEAAGGWTDTKGKRAVMGDLKRDSRVKVVDIGDSCTLSHLKEQGYERAERYKDNYQLDMILHTQYITYHGNQRFYFNLMDLYTKKIREVSCETRVGTSSVDLIGVSRKILVDEELDRVLKAKTAGLPK